MVEGANTWVYSRATVAIAGASTAASGCAIAGASATQHARHARKPCRLGGDGSRVMADDQHAMSATRLSASAHCTQRAVARCQPVPVMFGDDQYLAHQISPFAASAATSSPTSFTITPLPRTGGGA